MPYCQDCETEVVAESWTDHVRREHQLVANHHGVRYERQPHSQWHCPHPGCDKAYGQSVVLSRHFENKHKAIIPPSPEPPRTRSPLPDPDHVGNRRDGVSTSPRTRSPSPSPVHVDYRRERVPTPDPAPVASTSQRGRVGNQREHVSTSPPVRAVEHVASTSTHPLAASSSLTQSNNLAERPTSASTPVQDGSRAPTAITDFIFSDTLLATFDLVIDRTARVVLCRSCGHALRRDGVYNHIRDAHGNLLKIHKQSAKDLKGNRLGEIYGARIAHPHPHKPTPTVIPSIAIPYLKIHDGFRLG